ncbi:hypothetical protein [Paenibacillus sp. y28]|uniref:hypothetical protein n=1 Tax=Paenibacillus sp. y28 TaxID=3129110 RepID=UPI003018454A
MTLTFNATKLFITKNNLLPQAPVLLIKIEQLYEIFFDLFSSGIESGLNREVFESWISFYSFGSDKIFDLYYKPLIRMDDNIFIIPSIFLCNNIYRTFIKHLRMLKVNLSEKGEVFEKQSRRLFSENGLIVHSNNYPFQYHCPNDRSEIKGDIDIIAIKDKHIFVGEAKNHLDPLELDDYRAGNKVVKKGVSQIKKILRYIEDNKIEFSQKISIENLEEYTIVPFVLLSSYYGSGQIVEGIPVIDYSALDKYLSDGTLRAYSGMEVIAEVRLRGDDFTSEELKDFLVDSPGVRTRFRKSAHCDIGRF